MVDHQNMNKTLLIKNCRLYNSPPDAEPTDILIESKTIRSISREDEHPGITHIDAVGRIAVPGFLDVHIQGAGGADILDGTEEALQTISETLAKTGTTGFLGTTVVKPGEGNAHLKFGKNFCSLLKFFFNINYFN